MKETSLQVLVYDISIEYHAIKVSDILDSHKYLMEKNKIVV